MLQDKELTVNEVAAFAGVHKQTVWNWILGNKLPAHRIETREGRNTKGKGVEWRVYASDLAQFMSNRVIK